MIKPPLNSGATEELTEKEWLFSMLDKYLTVEHEVEPWSSSDEHKISILFDGKVISSFSFSVPTEPPNEY